MAERVSRVYGNALFEMALEEEKLEEMRREAETLRQIFRENREPGQILGHPRVRRDQKMEILENIFKGKCSAGMMRFLTLLTKKGRWGELDAILDYFIQKAREEEKIGTALIVSAVNLGEKERKTIETRLLALTGYESLAMTYQTNESLIGGLVIRIGDRVADLSVKTKLEEMKRELENMMRRKG